MLVQAEKETLKSNILWLNNLHDIFKKEMKNYKEYGELYINYKYIFSTSLLYQ